MKRIRGYGKRLVVLRLPLMKCQSSFQFLYSLVHRGRPSTVLWLLSCRPPGVRCRSTTLSALMRARHFITLALQDLPSPVHPARTGLPGKREKRARRFPIQHKRPMHAIYQKSRLEKLVTSARSQDKRRNIGPLDVRAPRSGTRPPKNNQTSWRLRESERKKKDREPFK